MTRAVAVNWLTADGQTVLGAEARRLEELVQYARSHWILRGT